MTLANLMSARRILILFGIPLIVIGGGTALFFLNPNDNSFFPKCSLYVATGYTCPGCGSTRALYHLTHGNVLEAFRLNPGLITLLLLSVTDYTRYAIAFKRAKRFQTLFCNTKLIFTLLGGMLIYGIVRNLPWAPFAGLAP